MNWQQFTKRTNDPKLGWIERQLDKLDIAHRRNGRSFHAPILQVDASKIDAAWAMLNPVDDIPDDDPRFTAEGNVFADLAQALEDDIHASAEPSKEKNITTRIYTYDVELDISYDGEDLVSSCFVSKTRDGTLYCSSLALLSDQGTIEGDNWGDVIQVPDKIITKIYHWAEDNGY